jgi:hypothetical protein
MSLYDCMAALCRRARCWSKIYDVVAGIRKRVECLVRANRRGRRDKTLKSPFTGERLNASLWILFLV